MKAIIAEIDVLSALTVITVLLTGALGVLFTRRFAYWTDWDLWTCRAISYSILALGIVLMGLFFGVAAALKAFAAAVIGSAVMVRVDERFEAEEVEKGVAQRRQAAERHHARASRARGGRSKQTYSKARFHDEILQFYARIRCTACDKAFDIAGPFVECPVCGEYSHEECWEQAGGCPTEGCPNSVPAGKRGDTATLERIRSIPYAGMCPACRELIRRDEGFAYCEECGAVYHATCWSDIAVCRICGTETPVET